MRAPGQTQTAPVRFFLTEPKYNQAAVARGPASPKLDGVTKSYYPCLATWTRRTGLAPQIGRRRSPMLRGCRDHCGLVLSGLRYRSCREYPPLRSPAFCPALLRLPALASRVWRRGCFGLDAIERGLVSGGLVAPGGWKVCGLESLAAGHSEIVGVVCGLNATEKTLIAHGRKVELCLAIGRLFGDGAKHGDISAILQTAEKQ